MECLLTSRTQESDPFMLVYIDLMLSFRIEAFSAVFTYASVYPRMQRLVLRPDLVWNFFQHNSQMNVSSIALVICTSFLLWNTKSVILSRPININTIPQPQNPGFFQDQGFDAIFQVYFCIGSYSCSFKKSAQCHFSCIK